MQLFAINLENIGQNKKALKQEQYKNGEQSQQTFVGLQDVLKTSSRHVLKTSSTRLQRNNFTSSKTSWRRLEDVFKTSHKTSSRRIGRRKIVTLKTSLRRLEDMPWRYVLKASWRYTLKMSWRQAKILLVISVSNKSKWVSNKSLFHKLCLRNLRRIQNASLRTHNFDIHLILRHTRISILKIKISEASEARKAKF